jgi:hypothetical protein
MANLGWQLIQVFQRHRLSHPICERCMSQWSVGTTNWGTIQACCQDCLDDETRRFEEYSRSNLEDED